MHRNDPKYSPILWWPQKNIHKIFIPQKILNFLKTPKNVEIKNFEPQKMVRAYVCMKVSEFPPPPWAVKLELFRFSVLHSNITVNMITYFKNTKLFFFLNYKKNLYLKLHTL